VILLVGAMRSADADVLAAAGSCGLAVKPIKHDNMLAAARAALGAAVRAREARAARDLQDRKIVSREEELSGIRVVRDALMRALDAWVLLVDRDLRVLGASDSFCRARGIGPMEVIGRRATELLAGTQPENAPSLQAVSGALEGAVAGREVRLSGLRFIERGPGTAAVERIVDVRASPVNDPEHRALLVVTDITEYWRAQEEVIREKRKLNDMVQATGAGLCLMDLSRKVTWANRAFLQWFGDPAGRSCFQVFRCTDKACAVCQLEKVRATGASIVESWSTYAAGGARKHFQNTITPIRDERGEVFQYLILTEDVTEREAKIEQLNLLRRLGVAMAGTLELDRLLNLVLTCVTAGHALGFNRAFLFLRDRATNRLLPKQAVGPINRDEALRIWAELAGRHQTIEAVFDDAEKLPPAAEQPLYRMIQDLAYPVEENLTREILVRAAIEKRLLLVADAGSDPRVSEEFRRRFGTAPFVVVPLLAKGEVVGVILADNSYSGRPITAEHTDVLEMFANQAGLTIENAYTYAELREKMIRLRAAQASLVHSENLATIGRMAAHVAHEIRNPLTTIGGFARSIIKHPDKPERIAGNAQVIIDEVRRLESILSSVMDFSRPAKPVLTECRLDELLKKVVAETTQTLAGKGVALDLEIDPDVPPIQADGEKLKQVIINLLRNAAEAMTSGGAIQLRLRRSGTLVEVDVTDTGPGIPAKIAAKIFSPFFTTKADGTGLGLAVSRKIVEDHGGQLRVRSELGKGSTFVISLPLQPPPELLSEADLQESAGPSAAGADELAPDAPADPGGREPPGTPPTPPWK
jgi:signal transduction histidine kinase/PAS domain-containing protein